MISGFLCEVDEICTLLGYYTAYGANSLLTYWSRNVSNFNGPEKLESFLNHLNCLHRNIHFTMEMERVGHPTLLETDIYRRLDSSLGNKVYRTPNQINLYLYPGSYHHPTNIQGILATWCTGPRLCVTRKASLMSWSFSSALSRKIGIVSGRYYVPQPDSENIKAQRYTHLPYVLMTYGCLSRMLACCLEHL
jgi:hypothetical protein